MDPLRDITTKLIRSMTEVERGGRHELHVFAFLILPGYIRALLDIKGRHIVDLLREIKQCPSPVHLILSKAHELMPVMKNIKARQQSRLKSQSAANYSDNSKVRHTHSRIVKFYRQNRFSQAMKVLEQYSEEELTGSGAGATPNTLTLAQKTSAVLRLNPVASALDVLPPASEDPLLTASIVITVEQVEATLSKLPKGSANGISGWTYDILRQLYTVKGSGCTPKELSSHHAVIAKFFNVILQGKLPRDQWLISRAVLIPKPDGNFRPLGIGETWYRLLNRTILSNIGAQVGSDLLPLQLGCSVSNGCEIGARLAQVVLESDPRYVMIKTDFKNAFNLIPRQVLYAALCEICPELCKWFRWAYGSSSELRDADGVLLGLSSTGCRQGDPLSFFLFCVGVQQCLKGINTMVQAVHTEANETLTPGVVGYADDFSIFTTWELAAVICAQIQDYTKLAHLQLNIEKCSIIAHPTHIQSLLSTGPVFTNVVVGDKVLGSPAGTQDFRVDAVHQKVESMSKLFRGLDKLKLPVNIVTTLLKFCISNRVSYLSKVLDPSLSMDAFLRLDALIDEAICKSIEYTPSDVAAASVVSVIRSLPQWAGGLAIPRYSWVQGHVGCIRSRNACQTFLDTYFAGSCLQPKWEEISIGMYTSPALPILLDPDSALQTPDETADSRMFPIERRNSNTTLDAQYIAAFWHIHSHLLRTGATDRAAWLLSAAHDHSNSWLYPSRNASSWFSNQPACLTEQEYLHALRSALLIAPHGLGNDVPCNCPIPTHGQEPHFPAREAFHFLDCPGSRCFRMWCHESVSNAVSKYLKKRLPGVAVSLTPVLKTKGPSNRIADLLVTTEDRPSKYIDFTVSNPAAPTYSHNSRSAIEVNHTNMRREKEKSHLYATTCAVNIVERNLFVPFAIESTGRLGNSAMQYLLDLFPVDARGYSRAVPLIKQLGIVICKYNAQANLYKTKSLTSRRGVVIGAAG